MPSTLAWLDHDASARERAEGSNDPCLWSQRFMMDGGKLRELVMVQEGAGHPTRDALRIIDRVVYIIL